MLINQGTKGEDKPEDLKEKPQPRIIIHGGAGNITPENLPWEQYRRYRHVMLLILAETTQFMNKPLEPKKGETSNPDDPPKYPSALDVAAYAVTFLENHELFNSGHGAVFTRDGINECEASIMVSSGYKKHGVGVTGLRKVKNPIMLAREILIRGESDLGGDNGEHRGPMVTSATTTPSAPTPTAAPPPSTSNTVTHPTKKQRQAAKKAHNSVIHKNPERLDAPTAQGHTLIYGQAAEQLAQDYGLEIRQPYYFKTERRWQEHLRALEREKNGEEATATWSPHDYLPQGTCGAVALDRNGVVCCATSTGGMTNKLTGRIGDTPVVGAGFWAEEWDSAAPPPPLQPDPEQSPPAKRQQADTDTTVRPTTKTSMALSGTGNGDSFLRLSAGRQVGAIARYRPCSTQAAVREVSGPQGELQKSAGNRWGKTGEGEGGMIGIETVVRRDENGEVVGREWEIIQEFNCAGMFRCWLGEDGEAFFRAHKPGTERKDTNYVTEGEGSVEKITRWMPSYKV